MTKLTSTTMALAISFALIPSAEGQTASSRAPQSQTASRNTSAVKVLNNSICPVSGEPIGSMGAGRVVEYKGYKFKLCCGGCVKKFNANPDAYLQRALQQTRKSQAGQRQNQQRSTAQRSTQSQANVTLKPMNNAMCPVSGRPVGSMQQGSNIVYNGYRVGLCCDGCKTRFSQYADAYLNAMLNQSQRQIPASTRGNRS